MKTGNEMNHKLGSTLDSDMCHDIRVHFRVGTLKWVVGSPFWIEWVLHFGLIGLIKSMYKSSVESRIVFAIKKKKKTAL